MSLPPKRLSAPKLGGPRPPERMPPRPLSVLPIATNPPPLRAPKLGAPMTHSVTTDRMAYVTPTPTPEFFESNRSDAAVLAWADEILGGRPLPREVTTIAHAKTFLDGMKTNLGLLRYRAFLEELVIELADRLLELRTHEGKTKW